MNVDLNKDLKDTLQKKTIKNTLNYFEVKNFELFKRLKVSVSGVSKSLIYILAEN